MTSKLRLFLIIIITSASVSSCTDTIEKLKRIGKAPDLTSVDIPVTQGDSDDPETLAQQYEDRKKRTNSLWQPGATSFFRDNRAWKVGDIIKIVVNISDSATLNNTSNQSRTGSDSLSAAALFGKQKAVAKILSSNANPSNLVSTNIGRSHVGTGGITRTEAIQTVIAGVVTQILANGNLVISGKQEVRVNYELREVKVTGIIRPRDIASDNSVSSNQIAEARISYGGRGIVSDVQQPRVGSQVVDVISPF